MLFCSLATLANCRLIAEGTKRLAGLPEFKEKGYTTVEVGGKTGCVHLHAS